LTGELPTRGRDARQPISYPHLLVLPELDEFLRRLLASQPAERPRDAKHAVSLVDKVLASYRTARDTWTRLGLGPCPY
jgi:hypothetical protein